MEQALEHVNDTENHSPCFDVAFFFALSLLRTENVNSGEMRENGTQK